MDLSVDEDSKESRADMVKGVCALKELVKGTSCIPIAVDVAILTKV